MGVGYRRAATQCIRAPAVGCRSRGPGRRHHDSQCRPGDALDV